MPRIDDSHITVDDLVDLGLIYKDGRPSDNMTDKMWQVVYRQLKKRNIPFIDGEIKKMKCTYIKATIDENGNYEADNTSVYQRYCMFINNTLLEIRHGRKAYAFYLHQIRVLLRFHPDLKTRFKEYYWEVWLDD